MIGQKIFCGLDVGSQKIKASVIRIARGGQAELLGASETFARGFKKSTVSDLGEFAESIHRTLSELSKKSGVKFKDVQLGIGGHVVSSRFSKAVIPLVDKHNKVITNGDMKSVNKQARLLGVKMDEIILHDFPQYYVIDDTNKVLNPAGLYGRKLAVASLLVVAPDQLIGNIIRAINQAGYEVPGIFFSSIVSAQAVLSPERIQGGCLLVDIGASTTNTLFFKDGLLRHLDIVAIGADHFTGSIAEALSIPFDLAEDIKRSHATALSDDVEGSEEVLVKKDENYTAVKRKAVSASFEPQIEKLLSTVKNSLMFSHLEGQLNQGIVVVGGGALLPGLIERMEKTLGIPVKMGVANVSRTAMSNASVFTAAIGLGQAGLKRPLNEAFPASGPQNFLSGFSNRVKELYEEYF